MDSRSPSAKKQCALREVIPFHHHTVNALWHIPDKDECLTLWDKYAMPDHIRRHSEQVAVVASDLAALAAKQGKSVCMDSVVASALLHDIAKAYTIEYGGDHAALGGSIVMCETGNPYVAQGVIHHVHWDWPVDVELCFLPLAIIYADKRVMHDAIVPLDERFEDLLFRYGKTDRIIDSIKKARHLAHRIEEAFGTYLGISLHEYSFDSRRMV